MPDNFKDALAYAAKRVQDTFEAAIDPALGPVAEAMLYATRGGKAFRGFFVMESARIHGFDEPAWVSPAAAVESVHAYSLVHDDMPLMDDDDLRRGQPTVHKKWDEVTAMLAGDALQALAFEMIGHSTVEHPEKMALSVLLARAAGVRGMVGGQALDIAAESAAQPLSLAEIETLQAGKTGALIEWSCQAGAVMAGADRRPLTRYGKAIGLAFQIADDILDIEGDAATVGKATQKDEAAGKATFVSHLGLDGAKRRAENLVEEACNALSCYGDTAETLREAAQFVIHRSR